MGPSFISHDVHHLTKTGPNTTSIGPYAAAKENAKRSLLLGTLGPPKPGRRLLNGVRRCRRGSAGGPLGPEGAPEGPWGCRGVPRGSVHQSCIDTGQSDDPSDDYKPRAALELRHTFFSAKTDIPQNSTNSWGLLQLAKRL